MEKMKNGMMATALAFATQAMGSMPGIELSPAQQFHRQRGKAPAGRRWTVTSAYTPGGEHCNVKPAKIRNPKIAAHVQMMHEKWLAAFTARHSVKLASI